MVAKTTLAFYKVFDIENLERVIFFHKYPRFSQFLLLFLVFFILTFDPAYVLSYLLSFYVTVFALMNEQWYARVRPIFEKLFFSKINPYINEALASQVKTFR